MVAQWLLLEDCLEAGVALKRLSRTLTLNGRSHIPQSSHHPSTNAGLWGNKFRMEHLAYWGREVRKGNHQQTEHYSVRRAMEKGLTVHTAPGCNKGPYSV